MTPANRDRIERLSSRLALITAAAIVLCLLGPILVILITGVVRGIATGEPPEHGGLAWSADGYPPFDPQLWLMWIPIGLVAVWIVVTIPVPLRRSKGLGRFMQACFVMMIFIGSTILIAGFSSAPWVGTWGTEWAPSTILIIGAVLVLRVVLGVVRLLPRSWRMYLDENGDVEPAATRSPLRDVPQ